MLAILSPQTSIGKVTLSSTTSVTHPFLIYGHKTSHARIKRRLLTVIVAFHSHTILYSMNTLSLSTDTMPQGTNDTSQQEEAVEKKRNWTGIVTSSVVGATVAIVAAPTIFAWLPAGAVGLTMASAISGTIGSSTTRILSNSIDGSRVALIIHQHPAQQFYRQAVLRYLEASFESVLSAVRMNAAYEVRNRISFDVAGSMSFQRTKAKEGRRMFFDLHFRVIPQDGSNLRDFDDGIPPPNLPEYKQGSTRMVTVGDNKSLLDGVTYSLVEGALFGVAGGCVGGLFPALARPGTITTVPGKVGVIVGIPSVTGIAGPLMNLAFPSNEPDRASLFIEFVTEVQCHLNRMMRCATENQVGLDLSISILSASEMEVSTEVSEANGSQQDSLHWQTEAKVNLS